MIDFKIDTAELAKAFTAMAHAERWLPRLIDKAMPVLGRAIVPIMRDQVHSRRYTGVLEESINWEYDASKKELSVGPSAKRGSFDAGLILQLGARSPRVPWRPIRAWGLARGMSVKQARVAWRVIQQRGVQAHPYLTETMRRPEFRDVLEAAATGLGLEISVAALAGDTQVGTTRKFS